MLRLYTAMTFMALLLACSAVSLTAALDASAESSLSSSSDEVPELTTVVGSFTAKNRVFRKLEIFLTNNDIISLKDIVCTGLTIRPSRTGGEGSNIFIDDSIIGEHGLDLGRFFHNRAFVKTTLLATNITVGQGRLYPVYIHGALHRSTFYFRDSHFAAHDSAPLGFIADIKDKSQVLFTNVQFTRDLYRVLCGLLFTGDISNSKVFLTNCFLNLTAPLTALPGLTTVGVEMMSLTDSHLTVRNSTLHMVNPHVKLFLRVRRRVPTVSCISIVDSTLRMRCGPLGLPSECSNSGGQSTGFHMKHISQSPSYFTVNDSSIDMVSDPGTSMFAFDSFQNIDALVNNVMATLVTNESDTREPLFTKIEYGRLAVFAVTNSDIAIPQGTGIYGPYATVPRNFSFFTMDNQWVVKNDVLRPKPDATINAKTACNTVNGNIAKLENLGTQIACNKTAEWVPSALCMHSKVMYAALGIVIDTCCRSRRTVSPPTSRQLLGRPSHTSG